MITLSRVPADEDPLLVWTAQGMRPGARAWTLGDAAAVACPDVARRDRLSVRGSTDDVVELLERLRGEVEAGFHPVGDEALIQAVAARLPWLTLAGRFGWMDTTDPRPVQPRGNWLADAEVPEVAALLAVDHPSSFAVPGGTGVLRWAGIRDGTGVLQAVGADAWSVPEIGFLGGVATRAGARGRGLATALCCFLTAELFAGRGRVALLVDHANTPAIRTYERLGYRMRRIAAARLSEPR